MNNSTLLGDSSGPTNFNLTSNSAGVFINPNDTVNRANAIIMPIFIAIAMAVVYLPARDFYAKRNFAACSMTASVTLLNLYQFLNAIIWNSDDTTDWFSGAGLCDIEVNSRYMLSTALMTSIFCFVKNLAGVFDTGGLYLTSGMKRKRLIIDVLICWLLPFLQVALHYLVSVGRFSIFPIFGCYDELDGSWPYVVGYLMWFPIFIFLTLAYSARLLFGIFKYRKTIGNTLASTGSGMTSKYFVKLTLIASSLLVVWVPFQIFYTYLNIPRPFHYYSFSEIHEPSVWNPIIYLPTSLNGQLQYNGWAAVATSLLIFAYFGFNNDAINTYRSWLVYLGLGRVWPSLKNPYVPQHLRRGSHSSGQTFFIEKLDLVNRAMKFFDEGLRKGSHATTTTGAFKSNVAAHKGSQGTISTNSTATMTDRGAISSLPKVPEVASPHLFSTAIQPSPRNKRPLFSTLRTHVDLPSTLFSYPAWGAARKAELNPQARACKDCGRGRNIRDLEAQHHPWTSDEDCNIQPGATGFTTTIWSDRNQSEFPPRARGDGETQGLKTGTKAYRERETAEYLKMENLDMSGAVTVENTMERRESVVDEESH